MDNFITDLEKMTYGKQYMKGLDDLSLSYEAIGLNAIICTRMDGKSGPIAPEMIEEIRKEHEEEFEKAWNELLEKGYLTDFM